MDRFKVNSYPTYAVIKGDIREVKLQMAGGGEENVRKIFECAKNNK